MDRWLFNWKIWLMASLTIGLAPFRPAPHIWGKVNWLLGGAVGMAGEDWLDLFLHGLPWVMLVFSLLLQIHKIRSKKAPSAVILLFSLLIAGCEKASVSVEPITVTSPVSEDIRFIRELNGTLLLGGGKKGGRGFLLRADEHLGSVEVIVDTLRRPLYDGLYFNGRYVFVSEDAEIIYSEDLSFFFRHWLKEENFVPTLHQQTSRSITLNGDSTAFVIAGGGELKYGLIQYSKDTFQTWVPTTFDNELRTVHFTPDGTAWAGGLGILLKSDEANAWQRIEMDRIYTSDISFRTAEAGIMSDFNGDIYYTGNGGDDWKRSDIKGKKGFLNKIAYLDDTHALAVGNGGMICESEDGGKSWECEPKFGEKNIRDLFVVSAELAYLVGEEGRIWKIRF